MRQVAIAIAFLGMAVVPFVVPAPTSAIGWDVEAVYEIDDEQGEVDFTLNGLYSHVIKCGTDWAKVDQTISSSDSEDRRITLAWSYTRAELRVEELRNHQANSTTYECASPHLATVPTNSDDWHREEYKTEEVRFDCTEDRWHGTDAILIYTLGGWDSIGPDVQSSKEGFCLRIGAWSGALSNVPYTGRLRLSGVNAEAGEATPHLYVRSCSLVVGVCWDEASDSMETSAVQPICAEEEGCTYLWGLGGGELLDLPLAWLNVGHVYGWIDLYDDEDSGSGGGGGGS